MKFEDREQLEFVPDTAGSGQGAWFLGYFLYFKKTINKSIIALDRTRKQFDKFLGIIAWLIIFVGWLSFALFIYLNFELIATEPSIIFYAWQEPNALITVFLLSLWFDFYLFYRLSLAKKDAKRIDYKFFQKTTKAGRRYNVALSLSPYSEEILADAYILASKLNTSLEIIHFFRAALKDKKVQSLFIRLDVDAEKLVNMVDRQIVRSAKELSKGADKFSQPLLRAFMSAFTQSYYTKQASLDILDILASCLAEDEILQEILYELEIDQDKIDNVVAWFRVDKVLQERYRSFRRLSLFKPDSGMNRAYTAIATPTLDHFSHDLTIEAKLGRYDLCVGRDQELKAIFDNLSSGHNGLILVGDNGVGKNSIIEGLAQLMVAEEVPQYLKDKRLVEIDISRLVSGVDAATAQERLLRSISEANRSGNIILFIDNIEKMVGISLGGGESMDLSGVLAESIKRGHIICLAAATRLNYANHIENKYLGTVLTNIAVKEPEKNRAIQILESKVGVIEVKYGVYVVYSAIEAAVTMSVRYLRDKSLPAKAIDLLEKSAMLAAKTSLKQADKNFCSKEDVALVIEELTGIPAGKISQEEGDTLLNLEEKIKRRLIGQEEAVKAVASSLRRARVALKDKKRPIASFLFLGPTGVGKTELAKTVADIYFGSEDQMIRLDMSEYQHGDSVKKMIGASDGTLGYLTEAIRKKPFSLILVDEIEKADANILNLFLQILDDGRLTDGQGRTVSFAESIIICTSNIGATYIQDSIKAKLKLAEIRQELIDNQLRTKMQPELINRFDGIIVFAPLTKVELFQIATLMLKDIKKNLAEKGINLRADKNGVMALAQAGYDPKFGARPLRRLLQERVEDVIANKILAQELKRRDQVLINHQAEIVVEKAVEL